jgi:hypothetical protein
VGARTQPDDIIIVPIEDADMWNRFRLVAGRPLFVDQKSHPYLASEVMEWRRRTDAARELYQLPDELATQRCRDLGARYYVVSHPDMVRRVSRMSLISCAEK